MSSGASRARSKGSLSVGSTSAGAGGFDLDDNTATTTTTTTEIQTVGTLLAAIATSLSESLRILMFADKRQWGPDEFEQTRVLEEALDEAKKDFQEMAPLVHGQFYYENDRSPETLAELHALLARFRAHAQSFRDWARQGGPINPVWARETAHLGRDLHRAQCRAARRIFAAEQEGARCLGAWQVHRRLKRVQAERRRAEEEEEEERRAEEEEGRGKVPAWRLGSQQQQQQQGGYGGQQVGVRYGENGDGAERGQGPGSGPGSGPRRRRSLEELVPSCNAVGRFQRFRESHDAAFVCDFCEGYIVWPDLREMPAERAPLAPTAVTGYPHWQAKGVSDATAEEKTVVFAPLAIANHMPPEPGDWQAGLICPFCEEDTYLDEGEDSSELRYVQDERGFPDLEAFREHLEWYHTAMPVPPMSSLAAALPAAASNCSVM